MPAGSAAAVVPPSPSRTAMLGLLEEHSRRSSVQFDSLLAELAAAKRELGERDDLRKALTLAERQRDHWKLEYEAAVRSAHATESGQVDRAIVEAAKIHQHIAVERTRFATYYPAVLAVLAVCACAWGASLGYVLSEPVAGEAAAALDKLLLDGAKKSSSISRATRRAFAGALATERSAAAAEVAALRARCDGALAFGGTIEWFAVTIIATAAAVIAASVVTTVFFRAEVVEGPYASSGGGGGAASSKFSVAKQRDDLGVLLRESAKLRDSLATATTRSGAGSGGGE